MYKLACAIALCLVTMSSASAQRQIDHASANFWLPKCRAPLNMCEQEECLSFFYGYDAGMAYAAQKVYCLPANVTFDQAIRIVVAYADRYPHVTHLRFGQVITEALREAFPCR